MRTVAREREVRVPRHGGDRALEERVGVVQEAGMARVFERREAAAGDTLALDGEHLEPGLAEIGRQNEPVVSGPEDDAVVGHHSTPIPSRR